MTTLTIRVYYVLWYLTFYVLGTRLQVDCVDSDDASIVASREKCVKMKEIHGVDKPGIYSSDQQLRSI